MSAIVFGMQNFCVRSTEGQDSTLDNLEDSVIDAGEVARTEYTLDFAAIQGLLRAGQVVIRVTANP